MHPDSKDPFIQGIVDTQKKLVDVLKTFDIEEFDPSGKEFDPNTQESLLTIPCPPGYVPNTVATTMRTGYTIQGRLLRSARVGIFVEWLLFINFIVRSQIIILFINELSIINKQFDLPN